MTPRSSMAECPDRSRNALFPNPVIPIKTVFNLAKILLPPYLEHHQVPHLSGIAPVPCMIASHYILHCLAVQKSMLPQPAFRQHILAVIPEFLDHPVEDREDKT